MTDFDEAGALEKTAGDLSLLGEVIRFTLDDFPEMINGLEAEIKAGRNAEVARIAHKAKGSAGACGAERLYIAALNLEMAGRDGDGDWKDLIREIKAAYDAFAGHPRVLYLAALDADNVTSIG